MKTINTLFPGVKKMITLLFVTNILVIANAQVKDSKKVFGLDHVGMMASVSGNGFGKSYSPQIGIRLTDKIVLTAGPVLKVDKPRYAGYKIQGNLTLLKAENSFSDRTSLYAFIGFERLDRQYFGKQWIKIEELTSRFGSSKGFEFSKVRFKGFEAKTGFALGYKVTDKFSLNSEFGLAVYKTKRINYQEVKLYHEPMNLVLHLSLTARIKIGN